MNTGITSARYAKALFRFAQENAEEKSVYSEMEQLLHSFTAHPQLAVMLGNPALTQKQLEELLVAAATIGKEVTATTKRFMQLLVKQHRAELAPYAAVSYRAQYRKAKGLIEARLTTAVPTTEAITERMRQMVEKRTGCKVSFETRQDAEIGGGFVLEYDTYRMDASLRKQFADLRRSLIG